MNAPEPPRGVIGLRAALLLYALLLAGAAYALKGNVRLAMLAVIALLAVKSCLHYFRRRADQDGFRHRAERDG